MVTTWMGMANEIVRFKDLVLFHIKVCLPLLASLPLPFPPLTSLPPPFPFSPLACYLSVTARISLKDPGLWG